MDDETSRRDLMKVGAALTLGTRLATASGPAAAQGQELAAAQGQGPAKPVIAMMVHADMVMQDLVGL